MTLSTKSELHVEQSGAGVPVVLLHSSGLSGRQWRKLARAVVERGMRAIVPDMTGHGASEPWPEPKDFSFHTDVDRIVALLEGVGPLHLVGHSYGGFIALKAALAVPRSIRSLVLYDPVAFGTLDRAADADVLATLAAVDRPWGPRAEDGELWLTAFVDYWGGPGAWSALREDARAEFRRVGWVVHEGVRTLAADETRADAYGAFEVPVHVLTGERSPLAARRVAEHLRGAVRDARLLTIPNAGHMAPLTHADLVNGAILEAIAPAS